MNLAALPSCMRQVNENISVCQLRDDTLAKQIPSDDVRNQFRILYEFHIKCDYYCKQVYCAKKQKVKAFRTNSHLRRQNSCHSFPLWNPR